MSDVSEISGFTPGPWESYLHNSRIGIRTKDYVIASMSISDVSLRREIGWNNARLIAAAPDMHAEIARLRAERDHLRREVERLNSEEMFARLDREIARLRREKAELVVAHEKIASECEELAATEDVPIGDRRCYRALGRIARATLRSATEKGELMDNAI